MGVLAPWVAPPIDVVLGIPKGRVRPTSTAATIAFACAGLVVFVGARVLARARVVEAFKIPAGSMIPTLLVGDHIFVDKLVYRGRGPRRGEVMVFAFPENPRQDFIKRVIALPGDRLEVRDDQLVLNGAGVPRCAVGPWSYDDDVGQRHTGRLELERLDDEERT